VLQNLVAVQPTETLEQLCAPGNAASSSRIVDCGPMVSVVVIPA